MLEQKTTCLPNKDTYPYYFRKANDIDFMPTPPEMSSGATDLFIDDLIKAKEEGVGRLPEEWVREFDMCHESVERPEPVWFDASAH
jgi:hypothetical protein